MRVWLCAADSSGGVFSENHLKAYSRTWIRYFLEPEFATLKHFHVYGLFRRERLGLVIDSMYDAYGQDVIFVYRVLFLGKVRSIRGACLNYRVHGDSISNTDGVYASRQTGRLRLLFFWQPLDLYMRYISCTPGHRKLIVGLLLPVKWAISQGHYLYKGQFLRRVLNRTVWPA